MARRDEEIADGEVREDDEHTKVLVAEHIRQKYACLALAEQESARKHEEHTQALVAEHLRQKHARQALAEREAERSRREALHSGSSLRLRTSQSALTRPPPPVSPPCSLSIFRWIPAAMPPLPTMTLRLTGRRSTGGS